MGRARKRQLAKAGDKVEKPKEAIDAQILGDYVVKPKTVRFADDDESDDEKVAPIDPKRLEKIMQHARQQELEERDEDSDNDESEPAAKRPSPGVKLGEKADKEDHEEDDDLGETVPYDPAEIEVDSKDAEDLARFLTPAGTGGTLHDLIRQRLDERSNPNLMPLGGDRKLPSSIPPEAVQLYKQVGNILSRYRHGKVPLAFKHLGTLPNWEDFIDYTAPENWSSAAMLYATKMFMSNQKKDKCQRFLNTILLPRIRDEIVHNRALNFHLYQALFKACFQPQAFFKGIIIPLAESGNCSLNEASIIGSALLKSKIPQMHSCAALFKLAGIRGTSFASGLYFILVLLRKRYALPYQVVDRLVEYFVETSSANASLPLLWQQTFLKFVDLYADDLSDDQITLLQVVTKEKHHHPKITPEILGRLNEAVEKSTAEAAGNVEPAKMEVA